MAFLSFKYNSFLKFIFKLQDNCFTMWCWFLLYNNANQS